MASPQAENGFSRLANELLEQFLISNLNGTQWAILMWVVRQTYGYKGRKSVKFSWYKIAKDLRMNHGGVVREGNKLIRSKIITIQSKTITIQKDYEQWIKAFRKPIDQTPKPLRNLSHTTENSQSKKPLRNLKVENPQSSKPLTNLSETTENPQPNHLESSVDFRRAKDTLKIKKDTIPPAPPNPSSNGHSKKEKPPKPLTEVQKVVLGWKLMNNIPKEDQAWDKVHFPRHSKSAKNLLSLFGNLDDALDCMEFIFEDLTKKGLTCTIETVVKHSDRYREVLAKRGR